MANGLKRNWKTINFILLTSKVITVRGKVVSDTLLETKYRYYNVVNGNFYDKREAYYVLRREKESTHASPIYRIISGIRV